MAIQVLTVQAPDQKLGPLEALLSVRRLPDNAMHVCEVVDFPGHLRMRGKANDMVKEARSQLAILVQTILVQITLPAHNRLDVLSTWSMRKTSPS